jgi:hypothetical protein
MMPRTLLSQQKDCRYGPECSKVIIAAVSELCHASAPDVWLPRAKSLD